MKIGDYLIKEQLAAQAKPYIHDKKKYKAGVKALSEEIKKRKMKMGGDLGNTVADDPE
jgi:hypothetical protein